jgi:DNA-binding transcriptional MerR regulator
MLGMSQAAERLGIAKAMLRVLSARFAPLLSATAGAPERLPNGRHTARKYTENDVEVLATILQLRADGVSDDEIEAQLLETGEADENSPIALTLREKAADEAWLAANPAAAAIGQAMRQLTETQQALLSTQHAQRELLSVVVNDALALKDENERLRKRLRRLEEEMNRLKESDWNHRLSLEERLNQVERQNTQKRSFWDWLRGM